MDPRAEGVYCHWDTYPPEGGPYSRAVLTIERVNPNGSVSQLVVTRDEAKTIGEALKLSGPCQRCGKFYIPKRTSQTTYCSSRCGNAATAVKRTREKWQERRIAKLVNARKAMQEWLQSKATEPWKAWIERKYPDITKKFLTRAVTAGDLSEPRITA